MESNPYREHALRLLGYQDTELPHLRNCANVALLAWFIRFGGATDSQASIAQRIRKSYRATVNAFVALKNYGFIEGTPNGEREPYTWRYTGPPPICNTNENA